MYRILKFVVEFFRTGFYYADRISVMRPQNNFTSKCGVPPPPLLAIESCGALSYLATGGNSDINTFPGFRGRYWLDRSILSFDTV